MRRYLTLLAHQVRASLLVSMQYRVDFLVDGSFTATAIVPLLVVFGAQRDFEGWTFGEALVGIPLSSDSRN
jgi:ABC-2 type transport system permease protein